MKSIRFRILIATVAVLLGTALAQSQSTDSEPPAPPMHEHGFGHEHMLQFLTRKLDLTDAQQAQIKTIMQKERPTMKPLMQQMHQTELQLKQYEEGTYDEAKVRALAAQEAQTHVEMTVQKTRIHNEIFQVLTADQQAKLKEIEANREARMQKHMHSASDAPAEQ